MSISIIFIKRQFLKALQNYEAVLKWKKLIRRVLKISITEAKEKKMKKPLKNIIAAAIVFCMMVNVLAVSVLADTKSSYWLTGISKAAGGQMKMYYKEDTLVLKGKFKRSSSRDKLQDAEEKKRSYSLKIADNCKVTFTEADNVQTISCKEWIESRGYKKGDEVSFISVELKIKNKKITRINFSA